MVEPKVLTVIKKRLRQYKGKPIGQQKLAKIREDIYKGTRKYKSAPFAAVKKWIKEARADMSSKKKSSAKKPAKKAAKQARPKKQKAKKEAAPERRPSEPIPTPKISQSVKRSLEEIKSEISAPIAPAEPMEVSPRRAPMVLDKVYLQSMSFEMASMRQALDRIGRQLDKLERELSAHRNGGDEE
ncbi:MAG: hypothetical protein V1822_04135 [Candidatus Micrarchaeota archaeon]